MKVEIPTGFKTGEIAYAAGTLVDKITETEIDGVQYWPALRDPWIDQIRGLRRYSFDLRAEGLRIGYRGFLENLRHIDRRGISILFDEPKLLIFADEEKLSPVQFVNLSTVLMEAARDYDLKTQQTPIGLIFPKETYATDIVIFDANQLAVY